jgi:hypothetical protein
MKAFRVDRSAGLDWMESEGLRGYEERLEGEVTGWATDVVLSFFTVGSVDELSREQLDQVILEMQDLEQKSLIFHPLALGLRNVVKQWAGKHNKGEL